MHIYCTILKYNTITSTPKGTGYTIIGKSGKNIHYALFILHDYNIHNYIIITITHIISSVITSPPTLISKLTCQVAIDF